MSLNYQQILSEIKKHQGEKSSHSGNDSYLSSGHFYYEVSNPVKRQIAKDYKQTHPDLNYAELIQLVGELNQAPSYEEKTIGSLLLEYYPKLRVQIDPNILDKLLNKLRGWAEIDTLCQGIFTADELLNKWSEWESLLKNLNSSKNINKRRASLVLLTGVVKKSADQTLSNLAFANIDHLKSERDILITKAISWLLRDLTKLHRVEVEQYLKDNAQTLPAIAIRETRNKLITGRK